GQARILESLALSNTSTEEEKARFLEYFKRWETLSSDIVAKASQYPELRLEQLSRSFGEGYEVFSDLRGYIDLLGERRLDHVNQFIDQSTQARESTRNHLWLLIVIVALVSLATTFLLPSLVITPLQKISHRIQSIAEGDGDLTIRIDVDRQDELGELAIHVNHFMEKLQRLITEIRTNANEVSGAAITMLD